MSGGDGGKKTHEVGYGKPPKAHRFKPGRSGNPRGRPKGSRNKGRLLQFEPLKKFIAKVAYCEVHRLSLNLIKAVTGHKTDGAVKAYQRDVAL